MVSWGRVWSGAFAWLAWTIVYGIIGVILIVVGVFVVGGSLNNLIFSSNLTSGHFYNSNLFAGFIFILLGWIIIAIGVIASFFKINSEIISEEVNHSQPIASPPTDYCCKTCGAIVSPNQKYCPECGRQLDWT